MEEEVIDQLKYAIFLETYFTNVELNFKDLFEKSVKIDMNVHRQDLRILEEKTKEAAEKEDARANAVEGIIFSCDRWIFFFHERRPGDGFLARIPMRNVILRSKNRTCATSGVLETQETRLLC